MLHSEVMVELAFRLTTKIILGGKSSSSLTEPSKLLKRLLVRPNAAWNSVKKISCCSVQPHCITMLVCTLVPFILKCLWNGVLSYLKYSFVIHLLLIVTFDHRLLTMNNPTLSLSLSVSPPFSLLACLLCCTFN